MIVPTQTSTLLLLAATCLHLAPAVHSFYSYGNDFVDPQYILSESWNTTKLWGAQQTIVQWADETAALGPWSVMNKSVTPPSGNKHDYMSWSPYWWPDCSKAGNTTALTPEQIWATCNYIVKDGQFNPDVRTLVNDVGAFSDMTDAILYNSLAWAITGSSVYSANVAKFINTWFLDPSTAMNPNLNYSQMQRGPTGQIGTHTGILDLKCMAKLVSGVLVLRQGKAPEWTTDIDNGLNAWTNSYLPWLKTAKIAIEEEESLNNHGSFYFNQLASLQILAGDNDGAKQTLEKYFTGIYLGQIAANGDQPLESSRTRPYHYRAYNLAAMITNARLGAYIGYNTWNLTTKAGTTPKAALDYAITKPNGDEAASELYTVIQAIGSTYGDADGKYAAFLANNAGKNYPSTGKPYPSDASFLWNQPFSDSGLAVLPSASITGSSSAPVKTGGSITQNANSAIRSRSSWGAWILVYCSCTVVMAMSMLDFF